MTRGRRWRISIGGELGKIFHLGKLPVSTRISAYHNVVKPDFGLSCRIRASPQLMFPKRQQE